jgi:tRNA threonylcarbamoyladenosine biosynthesis protein TsaE
MGLTITSHSPQETIRIGRTLGRQLRGGEVFAVCGPLGSGKTHLIKGIATGAGASDRKTVTSPTFVIINQYAGRFDIYHIDAYRLGSVAEFEMLGFDDLCYPESIVLIEWADKVEAALRNIALIHIELQHLDEHSRVIRLENIPSYIGIS